ncbi:MAG: hypothetical protein Q7Q73_08180 [Verrucomicrobiota bacterium JB024]|nr:hypothetical protein [Verrucomicrobiota bacterium JB024]
MQTARLFLLLLTLTTASLRAGDETCDACPSATPPGDATASPPPQATPVLGTWRLAKADGQSIAVPFYMRLDADGSALLWPIESGCSHPEHRISRAAFTLDDTTFTFIKNGSDTVVSTCALDGDTLTLRTPQGHEIIYHRDPDAPAPGYLPGETPAPAGEHPAHP